MKRNGRRLAKELLAMDFFIHTGAELYTPADQSPRGSGY